jgi:hypothetical protein
MVGLDLGTRPFSAPGLLGLYNLAIYRGDQHAAYPFAAPALVDV